MYAYLFKNSLHRVFVYGTLKRGEPNHALLKDTNNGYAKFLGPGKTITRYPLVIATKYNIPFLLKEEGTGSHVFGEVYDVDSKMLMNLDELEEHPSFYVRTEHEVQLIPESEIKTDVPLDKIENVTKAWIYLLPKFRPSLLKETMYSSYSDKGSHGLKYKESDNDTANLEDLL